MAVAKFAGDVALDGNTSQTFDRVLANQGRVVGTSAGDDEYTLNVFQDVSRIESNFVQRHSGLSEIDVRLDRSRDGARLLEDFFQHKVRKAAFAGGIRRPVDLA